MTSTTEFRVEARDDGWVVTGPSMVGMQLVNDYLGYLGDRHYAPGTRRSYAFDLLALCRWLAEQHLRLDEVDTAVLLRFLTSCQGLAAATVNRRLAAISGLFTFRTMREPAAINPMPKGPAGRRLSASQRSGLLGHLAQPQPRAPLRARQPQRLPRGLEHAEVNALLGSLRAWRDKAIAGLMLFSGLRSAEVLALDVADVDIGAGWARVTGKGGRERRAPVDSEVAGWVQAYLLAERPDTETGALFVVAKGPHRGQRLTRPGCARSSATTGSAPTCRPRTRTRCGTRSGQPWRSLGWISRSFRRCSVTSTSTPRSAISTWRRCGSAPHTTPPGPGNVPRGERRAAHVPGAAELVADYETWLAVDGHGSPSYRNAAWSFLARWPDPARFAEETLDVQQSLGVAQRPFITYLMATGRLRPGYDYLTRKIGGLLTQAGRGPLAGEITTFTTAASELDYSAHTVRCTTERVIVRLLIQTGRPLAQQNAADLDELAAAMRRRTQANGKPAAWAADRAVISTAHRVLFHLGILDTPPADPRCRPGPGGRCSGVDEPLRTVFLDYCTQAAATRAPATVKAIAGHLADFGRFLSACDPPVTDLAVLERATVEAWLAALAAARLRDGNPMSTGYRRGRIIAVRQFLTDIIEWDWPAAPARTLIFSRDLPRLTHPLPRYLPPDADRVLQAALQKMSDSATVVSTRLHADALLLTRATGLRIGELRDLELDCVHQIDGHGAWLKVPLGKLASERMVPLDEETLAVIDRIVARRTPGRPLPHPRTGRPVDFLLVHQGRRISACALREQLARAADSAGLGKITPHALRHTFATALVNAGCSLQALMQLLGHASANMSLRYGRLFDATVREEYERALTQTKAQLATAPAPPAAPPPVAGRPLPLAAITGGADWKDTATIKSRLAGGFCLRAPAQGSCSYANICEHCPNFRTDTGYLAVLGAQHADTLALAADAETRGWAEETTRHRRLADRLDELISQTRAETR